MTAFCWLNYSVIPTYRRRVSILRTLDELQGVLTCHLLSSTQLLKGITASLPFLFVRTVYAALSSYAPSPFSFVDGHEVVSIPSDSGLGRFSSVSPEWGYYLVMGVIMEYAAVLVYTVVGIITPLDKDMPAYAKAGTDSRPGSSEAIRLNQGFAPPAEYAGQQQYGYQPQYASQQQYASHPQTYQSGR